MTYVLGIDLGTTYCGAAVVRRGAHPEVVELGNRSAVIPSVVFLRDDATVLTGEAAARRATQAPLRVAREFKRRLGDTTPIVLGTSPYSAESLLAEQLRSIVATVEGREGTPPAAVCVTHPASWGPYKLDLLRQAVRLAEIGDVMFVSEPEAAAIHYSELEHLDEGAVVAVYDLGGGTFDAAVLRRTEAGFDILGDSEGIERLGGIDFDAAVFTFVDRALDGRLSKMPDDDGVSLNAVSRVRQECREAKEALTADTDATVSVLLPELHRDVRLTRSEFEEMIRPALTQTVAALERALDNAGVKAAELSHVLLVGGSARIPLVSEMLAWQLRRPVAADTDPKNTVALGAARHAARHTWGSRDTDPVEDGAPADIAVAASVSTECRTDIPSEKPELMPPAQATTTDTGATSHVGRLDDSLAAPLFADSEPVPGPSAAVSGAHEDVGQAGGAGRRRWRVVAAIGVGVAALVAAATLVFAGGGEGDPSAGIPAVDVTNVGVDGNWIQVGFTTRNTAAATDGWAVLFFFDDASPSDVGTDLVDSAPFAAWTGGAGTHSVNAFRLTDLPTGATGVCAIMSDGSGVVIRRDLAGQLVSCQPLPS